MTHRVSTRSSEGLERLNERRLLEIRSADLDRSLEIFSCTSFLRPFILWAKAKDGLEVVEDELEAAVGGRTCNYKNEKKSKKIFRLSVVILVTRAAFSIFTFF